MMQTKTQYFEICDGTRGCRVCRIDNFIRSVMGFFTHKLRLELAEIKHKHNLEVQEREAIFTRERKVWDEDKACLESDLKKDHEIKLREVVSLTKLDHEQKSKQMELNFQKKIADLESKNIKDMAEFKAKVSEEYFGKLSQAMTKLHEEGNVTTKFTQELALKMFDNAPKTKLLSKNVTVNKPAKDV